MKIKILIASAITVAIVAVGFIAYPNSSASAQEVDLLSAIEAMFNSAIAPLQAAIDNLTAEVQEQKEEINSLRDRTAQVEQVATSGSDIGDRISQAIERALEDQLRFFAEDRRFERGVDSSVYIGEEFDPIQRALAYHCSNILTSQDLQIGRGYFGGKTERAARECAAPKFGLNQLDPLNFGLPENERGLFEMLKQAGELPPEISSDVTFEEFRLLVEGEGHHQPLIVDPTDEDLSLVHPLPLETDYYVEITKIEQGGASVDKLDPNGSPVIIYWESNLDNGRVDINYGENNRYGAGGGPSNGNTVWYPPFSREDSVITFNIQLFNERGVIVADSLRTVTISGTDDDPSTTTQPSTTEEDRDYGALYNSSDFVSCIENKPGGQEALAIINGWIDEGLLRYEFPWGELTGDAASAVPPCEEAAGIVYDDYYYNDSTVYDCSGNADESSCLAQSGCYWSTDACYYGENPDGNYTSTSTTTGEMYSCFYPDATINNDPAGFTVWCEYDYQNCREGSQDGNEVSLDGLQLGAPSFCESGHSGSGTQASIDNTSFLASMLSGFTSLLEGMIGLFASR